LQISVENYATAWMIAGARVTGLLLIAPFLGSASLPLKIKIGIAVALTVFLVPLVPVGVISGAALPPVGLLAAEVTVGFLLGFTLQFLFDAAQTAGQVLGVQMGYSLASIINPDSEADSPVLALFYQLMVLLLFIQLSIPHWLLRALGRSFVYLPPGQFLLTGPAVSVVLNCAGSIFLVAVQIAAPVLVATLFADVALGFLGKASPQLPVLFVGLSIKSLIGMSLLCGAVAFWPRFFEGRFQHAIQVSERILQLAH
jgi:flagellar biosynthetic protein FliR